MKYQFEHKRINSCGDCPLPYEQLYVSCPFTQQRVEDYELFKPDWCPLEQIVEETGRH